MRIYKITVSLPYRKVAFSKEDKFVLANSQEEAEKMINEHYNGLFVAKNCWSIHNIDSIEINNSKLL